MEIDTILTQLRIDLGSVFYFVINPGSEWEKNRVVAGRAEAWIFSTVLYGLSKLELEFGIITLPMF